MVDIKALHVHYRPLQRSGQPYPPDKRNINRVKTITPENANNVLLMKKQIIDVLDKVGERAEYYYVVAEIEKSDGTPAYRTIVRKIML